MEANPLNTSTSPLKDRNEALKLVVLEASNDSLQRGTASKAADLLNRARARARESPSTYSDTEALYLVKAGELAMLLKEYAQGSDSNTR